MKLKVNAPEKFIYLVRHGQTESNVQGLLVGSGKNPNLTTKGIKDAYMTGQNLKDVKFDVAYCSELTRTYDTASQLLCGAGQQYLKIQSEENLNDISWGEAEGYTAEEFMKLKGLTEFPDAFGNANDSSYVSPIKAESKYTFCKRFSNEMDNIMSENENSKNILIVGHSSMQYWLQQLFPEDTQQPLNNVGVTILKYSEGKYSLVEYNKSFIN